MLEISFRNLSQLNSGFIIVKKTKGIYCYSFKKKCSQYGFMEQVLNTAIIGKPTISYFLKVSKKPFWYAVKIYVIY